MRDKGDEAPRLVDLGIAIADGQPIDWHGLESVSPTDSARLVLNDLRIVADIVSIHQRLTPVPDASSSVADELRETSSPPADATDAHAPADHRESLASWGHLRLIEQVGHGAFGEVYRAWDPQLDRDVALKLLRRRESRRAHASSVIEEGRLLARVRHPNVITVYGAERIGDHVGVWMEFIEGRTLEQLLQEHGPFDAPEAMRIGIDLCRALAAVHRAGLLHRDIKAQNVMRDSDGRIVLMDFGTGRDESAQGPDGTRDLAGTPLYLAPEIFQGHRASAHSDLYSVGVLLYRLVTGAYPVSGHSVRDVRASHERSERARLGTKRPDLPHEFTDIVDRALAPEPAQRYESAAAMEAALAALIQLDATGAAPEVPSHRRMVAAQVDSAVRRRAREMIGRPVAVLAALLVIATTGALATWSLRVTRKGRSEVAVAPALNFQARDWVIITRFENRTGDPALDGVLEYALERELANSRFVNVVPRERIDDALRLMKKPSDTVMDATIGREVSLRDGGIRALITGRANKVGRRYLLSGEIVDPARGMAVGTMSAEADGLDQVLRSLREFASRVRARLGETLQTIRADHQTLEKATTPSLRALWLYTQGMTLEYQSKWPAAGELLRQVIVEDPEFASAYIHLAWALRNQKRPPDEYLPHAERALQLSEKTPERERYFIRGSYLTMIGKDAEAVAAYEALLSLYPDHYWAMTNVILAYGRLGRSQQAIPYSVRRADLRPYDLRAQWLAAQQLASVGGNLREASLLARRARQRVSNAAAEEPWFSLLALVGAYERWLDRDVEKAVRDVDAVAKVLRSRAEIDQFALALNLGNFYLALGRLRDAELAFRFTREPVHRALVAFAWGDRAGLRKHIRDADSTNSPGRGPLTAMLSARAVLLAEAERVITTLKRSRVTIPFGSLKAAEGELALRRGDQGRGIALLEDSMQDLRSSGSPCFFVAAESLAEFYGQDGRYAEGVRVLEGASKERSRSYTSMGLAGMFWMRTQARLAEVYRRDGRVDDARAIEAELLKLLAYADADFPLLVELKARRQAAASPQAPRVSLNFQSGDSVLITHFDNRTGDPSLDDIAEYALERELNNSRFVNVVPRVRVEDMLRLMGKPPETRVDVAIGREMWRRDGHTRGLLTGGIEKRGATFVLSAAVMDPSIGVTVATITEEARTTTDLPRALRRLSGRVRETLGEAHQLIRRSDEQLEKVTTPSLTALRFYTESYRLGDQSQWVRALELAKQAVAEDPEFASAQIWLAWALKNTKRPPGEVEAAAAQAMRLADRTVDWERYWIVGSYHYLRQEFEKAIPAYEALLRLYPDHRWVGGNLRGAYHGALLSTAHDAWSRRDARATLVAVDAARRSLDRMPRIVREPMWTLLVGFCLALGRPGDAREIAKRMQDDDERHLGLALVAWSAGDLPRMGEEIKRVRVAMRPGMLGTTQWPSAAWLMIRAGRLEVAQKMLDDLEKEKNASSASLRGGLKGDLLLARGDVDGSIESLRTYLSAQTFVWGGSYRAADSLAEALTRHGDPWQAAEALKVALAAPRPTGNVIPGGFYQIQLQLRLAELHHLLGRVEEAREVEDDVAKLLAVAEPDFPLLVQLERLRRQP